MNKWFAGFLIGCGLFLFSPRLLTLVELISVFTATIALLTAVKVKKTNTHLTTSLALSIFISILVGISYQNLVSSWLTQYNPLTAYLDSNRIVILTGMVNNVHVAKPCSKTNTNCTPKSLIVDLLVTHVDKREVDWLQPALLVRLNWFEAKQNTNLELKMGNEVTAHVKLKSVVGYENEHGFNRQTYLTASGYKATGSIIKDHVFSVNSNNQDMTTVSTEHLNVNRPAQRQLITDKLLRMINQTVSESDSKWRHQDILLALTTGDKQLIDYAKKDTINKLGIGHFLAISGLHVGLIYLLLTLTLKLLIKFITGINSLINKVINKKGFGSKLSQSLIPMLVPNLLSLSFIWFYVFMIGAPSSAVRAALAISCWVLFKMLCVRLGSFTILLAVATCSIIWSPWSFLNVSWWLSFYAVVGIIIFFRLFANRTWSEGASIVENTKKVVFVAIAFQVFIVVWMSPMTMTIFDGISLSSIVTNLLLAPIFSIIVMPSIVIGTLTLDLNVTISLFMFSIADEILTWFWDLFIWFKLESGWFYLSSNTAFSLVFLFIVLISTLPFIYKYFCRLNLTVFRMLTLFILLFFGYKIPNIYSDTWNLWLTPKPIKSSVPTKAASNRTALFKKSNELRTLISVFDVGQGSSLLVSQQDRASQYRTGNFSMLIDLGPIFPSGANATQAVIEPTLQKRGIHDLTQVIVTHLDTDHIGDVSAVNGTQTESLIPQNCDDLNKLPQLVGTERVALTLIWPNISIWPELVDLWPNYSRNNKSCVILIEDLTSGLKLLVSGDVTHKVEQILVDAHHQNKINLKADVLIASHHGSKHSSFKPFIYASSPSIVVFSSGVNNRFGMPSKEVKDRYERYQISQYNTAESGQIDLLLNPNSQQIEIRTTLNKWSPFWKKQNPFSFHGQIR